MPMYQVQLKSTARRSFAPAAGLYGAGGSRNPPGACGLACDTALTARAAMTAPLVRMLRRNAMIVPLCGVGADYSWALGAAIEITRPSGMVTVWRNPSGLPSFAGRNFTEMLSPVWRAFGPVLPTPLWARAVAEPRVITHSVDVPSAFFTAIDRDPWGFVNLILATVPDISFGFFMSYTPARE